MKKIFTLLALTFLTSASIYSQTENNGIQLEGNDRDEHGCIPSAGATWSVIKNACIRVWEVGLQFTAYGTNTDAGFGATVIISDDKKKAEAFLPPAYAKKAIMLNAVESSKTDKIRTLYENKAEKLKVYYTNNMLIISLNDKAIFMNNAVKKEDFDKQVVKKKSKKK